MILSCSNISKAFGTEEILKHVSFHVEDHEKAAIVGINGAGKSTLLKIIVGELAADEGSVTIAKGKTLGYLAQHQDLHSQTTIYDSLLEVKRPILEMEQQIPHAGTPDEARRGRKARDDAQHLQPLKP